MSSEPAGRAPVCGNCGHDSEWHDDSLKFCLWSEYVGGADLHCCACTNYVPCTPPAASAPPLVPTGTWAPRREGDAASWYWKCGCTAPHYDHQHHTDLRCGHCGWLRPDEASRPTASARPRAEGPEHRCGVNGFNQMLGDRCPACDDARRRTITPPSPLYPEGLWQCRCTFHRADDECPICHETRPASPVSSAGRAPVCGNPSVPLTEYQRDALRVACFTCGAAVGEPCTTTLTVVPPNAARVHINRVIAAHYTLPERPDASE